MNICTCEYPKVYDSGVLCRNCKKPIMKLIRARNRQDKAAQRKRMRAWIIKQTGGRITTAEGYVMEQMRKESQS